ncbi:response regulator [Nocardioides marinus]|uniref:CheY-like chemotaxis protein n=1 Tax=Nocardioides marinus TaxID=374514 RepID=A0A7Y9YGC1_9ACTN|nr:response regulator [Nocardioides marinus]NYI11653.1 CheY-like chemotaxis protein [Nocardioides marinus]
MTSLLLAEDDHDLRDLTTLVLARHGCAVTAVQDGGAARDLVVGGARFDVLVLDLDMPVCTGIDVARAARAAGHTGRIILWTGWNVSVEDPAISDLDVRVLGKQDVSVLRSAVLETGPGLDLEARAG